MKNAHLIAEQCSSFFRAWEVMEEHTKLRFRPPPGTTGPFVGTVDLHQLGGFADFWKLMAPRIVCLAFAAELGIKALLVQTGKLPDPKARPIVRTGHHLPSLFKLLPDALSQRVRAATGTFSSDFDAKLQKDAAVFENWRYLYESNQGSSVDDGFLTALVRALIAEFEPSAMPRPFGFAGMS